MLEVLTGPMYPADMLEPPVRLPYQPLRILVSDVYQSQSTGVSVAGKVEAGSVRVKQKVLVVPIQEKCTVQVIDRHGERASLAVAGDNLELGLRGIDLEKLRSVMMVMSLSHCSVFPQVTSDITVPGFPPLLPPRCMC